jgi:hypothetical protein
MVVQEHFNAIQMTNYQHFWLFWLWVHIIIFTVLLCLSIIGKIFAKKNLTNDRTTDITDPAG